MNKLKVYIVGRGYDEYINWFPSERVFHMNEADLVMFAGGEDVSSFYYQEPAHPQAYHNVSRDKEEVAAYREAIKMGKSIIGICRGSQLTCVMAEGRLVQHQYNPGYHPMKTWDDKELIVSSTHHQAQYPFNLPEEDYKILGWTENVCKYHEDGNQEEMNPPVECEIVYYPKINALGIQLHPEYMPYEHETNAYLRELLQKFLNKEL